MLFWRLFGPLLLPAQHQSDVSFPHIQIQTPHHAKRPHHPPSSIDNLQQDHPPHCCRKKPLQLQFREIYKYLFALTLPSTILRLLHMQERERGKRMRGSGSLGRAATQRTLAQAPLRDSSLHNLRNQLASPLYLRVSSVAPEEECCLRIHESTSPGLISTICDISVAARL